MDRSNVSSKLAGSIQWVSGQLWLYYKTLSQKQNKNKIKTRKCVCGGGGMVVVVYPIKLLKLILAAVVLHATHPNQCSGFLNEMHTHTHILYILIRLKQLNGWPLPKLHMTNPSPSDIPKSLLMTIYIPFAAPDSVRQPS